MTPVPVIRIGPLFGQTVGRAVIDNLPVSGSKGVDMAIKHFVAGSLFVASGLIGVSSVAQAAAPPAAPVALKRPAVVGIVKTADLPTIRRLIDTRVADRVAQRELSSIAQNLGALHDGTLVGAWGLGCGAGCANGSTRWSDQPAARRADAIKAAEMTAGDRELLLKVNQSIETIGRMKGELVGAWGLGCGAGCARPLEEFGILVAQPR